MKRVRPLSHFEGEAVLAKVDWTGMPDPYSNN